jgi:hypothetical protein
MILTSKVTAGKITIEGQFTLPMDNLTQRVQEELIKAKDQLGASMFKIWRETAGKKLKSSKGYVDSLQQEPNDGGDALTYKITQTQRTSDGKFNVGVLLEDGIDPFDMKEKLLKGATKKVVRFIYGSPGQNHSTPLPSEMHELLTNSNKKSFTQNDFIKAFGDTKANTLSPRKIKFFTAMIHNPKNLKSENFPEEPPKLSGNVSLVIRGRASNDTFAQAIKYEWKTPELHNIKKDTYQSGSEEAVHTFSVYRTVTKGSPANSWFHPGIVPKRILAEAMEEHSPTIRPILTTALQIALGDK